MKNKKRPKIAVRIDNSLDKYKDRVLNQEKLDKANKTIERIGLPDLRKLKMRDYRQDPTFIKKAEEAKKFIKKNGLPESFKKKG